MTDEVLLEVRGLRKVFPIRKGLLRRVVAEVKAVDGVDLDIVRGETVGLVGESGCGKTTAGRSILHLTRPSAGRVKLRTAIHSGGGAAEMFDVTAATPRELKLLRRDMQIIFQDPYSSLDPRMNVGDLIGEPLKVQGIGNRSERMDRVRVLLKAVGLSPDHIGRHPHEFSGGQRQRIGIARALTFNPNLIVADEPVSALDVSVQAQVINLMQDLQAEFGLTYLFIAHDLSVVRHISRRVAVMYLGRIVEFADTATLFAHPRHPYTEALMSAVPVADPDFKRARIRLQGDVPSPINPPPGCPFHPRCPYATAICRAEVPVLRDFGNHLASCHRAEELSLRGVGAD
jgi:oligopeptide/dipeptide ABC transporter ATP-binding protein